jgi:O-antigen ligase
MISPTSLRLPLLATLLLLAWFPPESNGLSMAGCALLLGLLALAGWSRGPLPPLLVVGLLLAVLRAWTAATPAAAVEPLALFWLAVVAGLGLARIGDLPSARAVAPAVVVAAAVVALHALYQKGWGLEQSAAAVLADPNYPDRDAVLTRLGRGRAFAGFPTPAALGGYLCIALPVAVGWLLSEQGRRRMLGLVVAALSLGAFVAAASATATAALLGALMLAAVVWGRARKLLLGAGVVMLAVLALVVWLRGDRLVSAASRESPWKLRAGNFRVAAAMAAEHPWAGVGPGSFGEAYPRFRRADDNETQHAHDLPLELAAEWGWPAGLFLAALLLALLIAPLWFERRGPPWRQGIAVGLAAFALQNLADFTIFMPSLLWTAALLRGALAVRDRATAERGSTLRSLLGAAGLVAVTLAVALAMLSGLAREARLDARAAAFAGELPRAAERANAARRLARWDADALLLSAQLTLDRELAGGARPSDDAVTRVEDAVRLAPQRAAARELRARLRLGLGDLPGAYADLEQAVRLNPFQPRYAEGRDRLLATLTGDAGEPAP